jgi:hypothetical protein
MPTPTESTAVGPVEAFWRFRTRALPVCVLLAILAAVFAYSTSGRTTVTTAIYLTDPRGVPVFRDGTTAATDMATYLKQRAEFAQSDTAFEQVLKALDDPTLDIETLREIVSTSIADNSSIIVECDDDDSVRAFAICSAVTDAYTELTRADTQRRADIAIGELQAARQALLADLPEGQTTGSIGQIEVDIAQTAKQAALFDETQFHNRQVQERVWVTGANGQVPLWPSLSPPL